MYLEIEQWFRGLTDKQAICVYLRYWRDNSWGDIRGFLLVKSRNTGKIHVSRALKKINRGTLSVLKRGKAFNQGRSNAENNKYGSRISTDKT